jgi:BASS family bile acid:Na+ symporter
MKQIIIDILKIVAPVSVALIVFAQGLGIAPSAVASFFKKQPGLLLRSLFATLVLVPAAALGIILLFKPSPGVAIALAILAACPPAPLMIKAAPKMGGGNAAFMASLHLSLAALAILSVPGVLYLLSIPLAFEPEVNLGTMVWILARTILIPITLGLVVRALFPQAAERLATIAGKVGTIGLGIVVLIALVALFPALLKMDPWSYLVIALISVAALAIGHFSGPRDPHLRTIVAIECGVRHPALALTIAAANFTPQKALPVLVPCVFTFILLATIYLFLRGRSAKAEDPLPRKAVA